MTVRTTRIFRKWLRKLRDGRARAKIALRIDRAALGNLGDCALVGNGSSEMRIFHGPGYRVYFVESGPDVIVLLCGGDKSTQSDDIEHARLIATTLDQMDVE